MHGWNDIEASGSFRKLNATGSWYCLFTTLLGSRIRGSQARIFHPSRCLWCCNPVNKTWHTLRVPAMCLNFVCVGVQALQLVELEFQMAVRDQIIDEQRSVVGNLWKVLGELAPSERISDIACELGIEVDNAVEGTVQVCYESPLPHTTFMFMIRSVTTIDLQMF